MDTAEHTYIYEDNLIYWKWKSPKALKKFIIFKFK